MTLHDSSEQLTETSGRTGVMPRDEIAEALAASVGRTGVLPRPVLTDMGGARETNDPTRPRESRDPVDRETA